MTNKLKEMRARCRVTQFRLGLKAGINQSRISLAENELIELTATEKKELANALGVSVGEIWEDHQVTRKEDNNEQRKC